MKSKILLLAIVTITFFGCKKDDKESCSDGKQNQGETKVDCGGPCPPCPVNTLCDGNGSATFWPLSMGNTWFLDGMFSNDVEIDVVDTTTMNSNLYYEIEENLGATYYLRAAANGDIMIYKPSDNTEHLFIPAAPTVDQEWNYPISFYTKRKVISTNATVTTGSCTYTGLVQIQVFTSTSSGSTFYFKRGLGMVRTNQIAGSINSDLSSVTLN
jgi:hypothetical protein